MHYNYQLSIILPGIRREFWSRMYDEIGNACKNYTWELIIVGPYALPQELQEKKNVKYIKDFGTPTRAFHLGTLISEGEFITWLSDDAFVYESSIDWAMDLLMSKDRDRDIICMRYSEGVNHSGQVPPEGYWTAHFHADLRVPGVASHWKIAPVMMLNSEYYRYMGGLDHGFEHLNMNVHDLAFRAQRNGSQIYLSPTLIMRCDFEPERTIENSPVIAAYHENDSRVFREMYDVPNPNCRPIRIDPENWKTSQVVWHRRKYS